jgi:phosphoglycolate phosphatase-like HAD superfamily hydrolase
MASRIEAEYSFPGKVGLLTSPAYVDGTDMRIVRPYDGTGIKKALFDLDGTISAQRRGWVNLMVACNTSALAQAVDISPEEAEAWVKKDIQETTGIPTYTQMRRLNDEIVRRGGNGKGAEYYKRVYVSQLNSMVEKRNREKKPEKLRIPGAYEFLDWLAGRLGRENLYLGSGTDIEPVLDTVRLLGLGKFFDEKNILASGITGGPEQCAKELVIRGLIESCSLGPGELVTYGDGFPEILHTHNLARGYGVAVITSDGGNFEHQGYFTTEKKESHLIRAGAHIVVPGDFTDLVPRVEEVIFSKRP